MPNTNVQTWQSGDWKKKQSPEKPYNGIEITVTSTYDPDTDTIVSAMVLFTDYSNSKKGVISTVPLLPAPSPFLPIPAPPALASPPKSPPDEDKNFTITGKIALEKNGANFSPRIKLTYGLPHKKREEIGYLMVIPMIQKPSK